MAGSRLRSSFRTWSAVAVQALSTVADRIRALFAAVAVYLSAADTLANTAASGEGPFNSDQKNFGHRQNRSSQIELWPMHNHLA